MLNSREIVLDIMREFGRQAAENLQIKAAAMTGTELYASESYIPDFMAAKAAKNMLERKAGFVCRSSAGRVVRLIQPYDSTAFSGEPEELPAQWAFAWSTDPFKARPFVAISTSPYMTGDCAVENETVFRSKQDNNVWAPSEYAEGWEELGPVGGPFELEEETPEESPEYQEWNQPTGSHDAYNAGDVVLYKGVLYRSKTNGNVWAPDVFLDNWEVIG